MAQMGEYLCHGGPYHSQTIRHYRGGSDILVPNNPGRYRMFSGAYYFDTHFTWVQGEPMVDPSTNLAMYDAFFGFLRKDKPKMRDLLQALFDIMKVDGFTDHKTFLICTHHFHDVTLGACGGDANMRYQLGHRTYFDDPDYIRGTATRLADYMIEIRREAHNGE